MTRVNLLDPTLLADQHLMAEYRELLMVPAALRRSLKTKSVREVLARIPDKFTLNAGHVRFFYNKLAYLHQRYDMLRMELTARGFNLDPSRRFDVSDLPSIFYGQYTPTEDALRIIGSRLRERVASKPAWYKYYGGAFNVKYNF